MNALTVDYLITVVRSILEYNGFKIPVESSKDYPLVYESSLTETTAKFPNHENLTIHFCVDQLTWDLLLKLGEIEKPKGPLVSKLHHFLDYGTYSREMCIVDISLYGRDVTRLIIYKEWEYEFAEERSINGFRCQTIENMAALLTK